MKGKHTKKPIDIIYLIGMMGAGKSTIAQALAQQLKWDHLDTDAMIVNRVGMSIYEIFSLYGEHEFRALEHSIMRTITSKKRIVVSTGGGLPCFNNLISQLLDTGLTIYLSISPELISERIHLSDRPFVKGKAKYEISAGIEDLLNARRNFYEQAHFTLDAERDISSIISAIQCFLVES